MDRALLRGPSYGDELKAWSVRLAPLGPTPRLGTVSRIYATMLFVRTTTNREVTMRLIADDYEGLYLCYARMIGRACPEGPGGRDCYCCGQPPGKNRKTTKRRLKRSEKHALRASLSN